MAYIPVKQREAQRRERLGLPPKKECKWTFLGEKGNNYFDKKERRRKDEERRRRRIATDCF